MLDPGGRFFRYLVLFLICYVNTTQYLCIEMPSGLQRTIIKVFKLTSKEYNLLFSAYTWPDVVLSVVGGILIDRVIGARAGYLMLIMIATIGKGLVTLGAFLNSFYVILAGRFVMGCGIGSLISVGNVFLSLWFKDKEVVFAMSLKFCSGRLGASLGLVLPQMIYEKLNIAQYFHLYGNHYKVGFTFLFGFTLLFSSLIVSILIVLLDIKGSTVLRRTPSKRKFNSKDLKDFSLKFWMSIVCLAIFYAVLFVFVANGQMFFISRFGLSTKEANTANFLVFAAPILITPIVGFFVQVIGFNVIWGISGALVAILTHILFNVLHEASILPYLLASLLSFAYSLYGTAIYVLPSLIVQRHQLTTAYSLYNTVNSVILTSNSVIAGTIIDHAGFMWLETFYAFLLSIILVLLVVYVLMELFSTGDNKKGNTAGRWVEKYMKSKWENKGDQNTMHYSGEYLLVYNYNDDINDY